MLMKGSHQSRWHPLIDFQRGRTNNVFQEIEKRMIACLSRMNELHLNLMQVIFNDPLTC